MEQNEFQPLETPKTSEGSEGAEAQKLDDATIEPRAFVEQTGDYRQAEAIQDNFTAVIENAVSEAGRASQVAAGSSGGVTGPGGDGVAITPINLPGGGEVASGGTKGPDGDPSAMRGSAPVPQPVPNIAYGGVGGSGGDGVAITPINLPGGGEVASGGAKGPGGDGVASGTVRGSGGGDPVGDIMGKFIDGDIPTPLPNPVEEIGQKNSLTGAAGIVETPLPAPAGETGYKEQVGDSPMPLPRPAGEVEQKVIESAAVDHMVARGLDSLSDLTEEQQQKLQESMENENKKFTVVSNIIKDSHDTAKNAINNIK
jgi:hypothetical protein